MGILEELYEAIRLRKSDFRIVLPHSAVFYARAAIEQRTGHPLTLEQTERALFEEGYFPARAYGIPKWYRDKYPVDPPADVERFPSWYNNHLPAILTPIDRAAGTTAAN